MTTNQKIADFQSLGGVFAKRYAFYEWKKIALNYDGLDLTPWLQRVSQTPDDLSYFDICAEYVAAWQDSHAAIQLDSSWQATIPLSLDVYDGRVVIDYIDRSTLPEKDFPFQVGDQLLSINAITVEDLMKRTLPVSGMANKESAARLAASAIAARDQSWWPRAHEVEDYANVQVMHADGKTDIRTLTWNKLGISYTQAGVVPDIGAAPAHGGGGRGGAGRRIIVRKATPLMPDYMKRLFALQVYKTPRLQFLKGEGAVAPFFAMPDSFVQRLGKKDIDEFFTGTLTAGAHTVGFIRIPTFEFFDIAPLQSEILWMESNTDAIVLDVTRNPGGYGCSAEQAAQLFFRDNFKSNGQKIRVTWNFLWGFEQDLMDARGAGAPQSTIDRLTAIVQNAQTAYRQNRGFTDVLPICGDSQILPPATGALNLKIGYDKPVLLLTDNMSASAAELFASILQDNGRVTLYGTRTMGAGGAVFNEPFSVYMDAYVRLPETILVRNEDIKTGDYPTAPYVENIGVRPDIEGDYMTVNNLIQNGKPFVDGFTKAVSDLLSSGKSSGAAAVR